MSLVRTVPDDPGEAGFEIQTLYTIHIDAFRLRLHPHLLDVKVYRRLLFLWIFSTIDGHRLRLPQHRRHCGDVLRLLPNRPFQAALYHASSYAAANAKNCQ